MFFRLMAIILLLVSCSAQATQHKPVVEDAELNDDGFAQWGAVFKVKAIGAGISPQLVTTALANIHPVKKVVALDRKQPETTQTLDEYLDNVITQGRIDKGHKLLIENREVLNDISRKTGVEPEFIVALWGLESGFGEKIGDYPVVKTLATLAYEGRRRDFFESELIDALKIIQDQQIRPDDLRGSWAGAMGQCQFMPSSYLKYGVDYDNDGYVDIWTNKGDVFASIANYLKTVGWGNDEGTKEKALKHWNHSSYFVASVFELAESIK